MFFGGIKQNYPVPIELFVSSNRIVKKPTIFGWLNNEFCTKYYKKLSQFWSVVSFYYF